MSTRTPAIKPGYAVTRIDRLIGRVFTLATLIDFLLEVLVNAVSQKPYLLEPWLGLALAAVAIAHALNFVNFWFLRANRLGYLLHIVAYALAFATWGLQVGGTYRLPEDATPWLWWCTGTAALAAGMFVPRLWSLVAIFAVAGSWVLLSAGELGGAAHISRLATDFFYVLLFSGTITALLWLLRQASFEVDRAFESSLEQEANRVRLDAQQRETKRLNSLVYSAVFEALKKSATAKDSGEYSDAARLSKQALTVLEEATSSQPTEISAMSLFESLEQLAKRLDPTSTISVTGSSLTFIPKDVATAISDAFNQAITNSIQHAGSKAKRKIRLKSTSTGLKVVIIDDGQGFRPSRVPNHSLGFKFVIVKRIEDVGGQVHIDSSPSKGTTIVLEWDRK